MSRFFTIGLLSAAAVGVVALATASGPSLQADDDVLYSQDFNSPGALDAMTILNENGDYREWEQVFSNDNTDGMVSINFNGQMAADDWMILPPLEMKGGYIYKVRFEAWAYIGNQYPERIEVKGGTAPTAAAMTTEILPPTLLNTKDEIRQLFECTFVPESDGTHYIGFHAISDADMSKLFVDNIRISVNNPTIAAASTDLTVTADPMGSNKAEISFKAPALDMTGAPLSTLEKIELLREDELIHTFDHPTPGESLTYTDLGASRGLTIYHVVAYTSDGAGMDAFATAFLGVNTPAPCPSVTVVESASKPGQVTISWEVPEVDVDGNPINPDLITYEVVERNGYWSQQVIQSDIRGTSYTYQAVPAGEPQVFKQWGVYAYTANGTKHDTRTGAFPVGTPYDAPYTESFADGSASSILSSESDLESGEWQYFTDEGAVGATSQDGDNGFVGLLSSDTEHPSSLALGKVSLAGVENPGLSFYLYNPQGALGAILDEVSAEVSTGAGWEPIYTVALEELALTDAWNRVMVSLDEFEGKTVSVRFVASIKNGGMIYIDNIRIGRLYASNIGATAVSSPAWIKPDTDFNVDVTVANLGTEPVSGYDVTLFRNGVEVSTMPGTPVGVCDEVTVSFTDRVNVAADDLISYQAIVKYDADEDSSDDRSRRSVSTLQRSLLPAPTALSAAVNADNTVDLAWAAPDMEHTGGATVTESFELADSWAIDSVEGWTFHDADGAETISLQAFDYPGKNSRMAYQVFDRGSAPFNTETGFDAASGKKYLASFCARSGRNDDWAISPRLSGNAQTVTLMASSFEAAQGYEYLESFEFLFSKSGNAPEDFELLSTVNDVPASWTEYQFLLPEGAAYFAIRCISEDKFIFMIDDVTYEPDVLGGGVELKGYNVYRDEVRLNSDPVASTSFRDLSIPEGDHTYVVSALYTTGESGISNLATAHVAAGIAGIDDNSRVVSVTDGTVTLIADVTAEIYDLGGRRMAILTRGESVSLPAGIYVIRTPESTFKILI